MSAKTNLKVTKTKTALKQETYNLSDLKHDLHCQCGFVELGGSVSDLYVCMYVCTTMCVCVYHDVCIMMPVSRTHGTY